MKKIYIFMAIVAITFCSCKKDENNVPTATPTNDPIAEKLLDFKQTIQSQNKEAVLYSIQDAEWYLEGLLNYEEANNEHSWHGLKFENRTYEIAVSEGQISSNDLNQAYESFLAEINNILVEDENFRSDLVSIEIEENQMKDGAAKINMTYSFGSTVNLYNYVQFGPTEYWVWCEDCGPCGPNPSTETTGGTNLLQYKLNHPFSTGQIGYYTNVSFVFAHPMDFPENSNNPAYPDRRYIMYQGYSWDDCLSPAELNFYLNHFDLIKANKVPSNKDYKSVEVYDDLLLGTTVLCHAYKIFFGNFHLGEPGIE